jgi:mannose-6-phosphate isomerase-like protein (cupin superfamily)
MTEHCFPGGTSVSRLAVYPDRAVDGHCGGTPHLHTASAEAYIVVAGRGALHSLDMHGFRETDLSAGSVVWFTPGTIHRAINHDGLEVVVVMQNAGLPEAGDAVMTLPPEIVRDRARYWAAVTLPRDPERVGEAVRRRRDLAVGGWQRLVQSAERGDFRPLEAFYDSAVALVRPAVAGWREIWESSVARQAGNTDDVLAALARGDGRHLRAAAVLEAPPSPDAHWGMCGRLRTHDVAHPLVHSRSC